RALWRAHQRRMRRAAATARARRPKAALAAADPMALRGVLLLAALGAVIIAGPAARERLADAFAPRLLAAAGAAPSYQAWINPPAYTGRAPLFLEARAGLRRVQAPRGSEFVARAAGAGVAPRLRVAGEAGTRRVAFEDAGPGAHEARLELQEDARLTITGAAGASWDVEVLADAPPAVAFIDTPAANERQFLEFTYRATDDYGLQAVVLRITRREPGGAEVEETPISAPASADGEETASLDLTEHAWAGLEVDLQIAARDGLGQEGVSAPVRMELPERVFVDPLARAIVHERRQLVRSEEAYAPLPPRPPLSADDAAARPPVQPDELERRIGRAPDVVARARRSLELMQEGAELFAEDYGVHLGLSYLSERLQRGRGREDIADLPDVMWDTALRAEGGDLADAERALREAQKALADALARGAEEAEIAELMEQYQSAVQRYLEALTAQAIMDGAVLEEFAGGGSMSDDDLQEMLKALQELTEAGATDDARRLLQALSEMLLNMQMQLAMGQGGQGEPSPELQELREELEELSDMIGRQRELMDQTLRESGDGESERGEPSDEGGASGGYPPYTPDYGQAGGELTDEAAEALAEAQRGLMEELQALADEMAARGAGEESEDGEPGPGGSLDDAEEAMGFAERALRSGDGEEALVGQGEALERMRAAAERLARRAMETARREAGLAGELEEGDTRDPFGRRSGAGGLGVGNDVDVPDEMERRRAREILEELRRRAEETDRPLDELDYIMRLLDRF
ncbi:MAG: DUF4175 domain-containing protein, partial [Caulobacterales bacterium]|nr:DUF4175 domain-containing protein [Caulobacterales bacterium]